MRGHFLALSLCAATLLVTPGSPVSAQSKIGYATVEEARKAVVALPGARASEQEGWLIVEQALSLWSFTPRGHEAHPAVVKRTVVERDGQVFLDMTVLCEAPRPACDRLIEDFHALNEQARRSLSDRR
jgi:hypothetical protein